MKKILFVLVLVLMAGAIFGTVQQTATAIAQGAATCIAVSRCTSFQATATCITALNQIAAQQTADVISSRTPTPTSTITKTMTPTSTITETKTITPTATQTITPVKTIVTGVSGPQIIVQGGASIQSIEIISAAGSDTINVYDSNDTTTYKGVTPFVMTNSQAEIRFGTLTGWGRGVIV